MRAGISSNNNPREEANTDKATEVAGGQDPFAGIAPAGGDRFDLASGFNSADPTRPVGGYLSEFDNRLPFQKTPGIWQEPHILEKSALNKSDFEKRFEEIKKLEQQVKEREEELKKVSEYLPDESLADDREKLAEQQKDVEQKRKELLEDLVKDRLRRVETGADRNDPLLDKVKSLKVLGETLKRSEEAAATNPDARDEAQALRQAYAMMEQKIIEELMEELDKKDSIIDAFKNYKPPRDLYLENRLDRKDDRKL